MKPRTRPERLSLSLNDRATLLAWAEAEAARWRRDLKRCRRLDGSMPVIVDAHDCEAYAKWFARLACELKRIAPPPARPVRRIARPGSPD